MPQTEKKATTIRRGGWAEIRVNGATNSCLISALPASGTAHQTPLRCMIKRGTAMAVRLSTMRVPGTVASIQSSLSGDRDSLRRHSADGLITRAEL